MSNPAHIAHATHKALETRTGHKVTAAAVGGTVAAAKLVGGASLAATAAVAAPVAVPLAIAAGAGYLASKFTNSKH